MNAVCVLPSDSMALICQSLWLSDVVARLKCQGCERAFVGKFRHGCPSNDPDLVCLNGGYGRSLLVAHVPLAVDIGMGGFIATRTARVLE